MKNMFIQFHVQISEYKDCCSLPMDCIQDEVAHSSSSMIIETCPPSAMNNVFQLQNLIWNVKGAHVLSHCWQLAMRTNENRYWLHQFNLTIKGHCIVTKTYRKSNKNNHHLSMTLHSAHPASTMNGTIYGLRLLRTYYRQNTYICNPQNTPEKILKKAGVPFHFF